MILESAVANLETFPELTGSSRDNCHTLSGLSLIKRDYTWILKSKLSKFTYTAPVRKSTGHRSESFGQVPGSCNSKTQKWVPLFPWKSIHFRDKKTSFLVFFIKESKIKLRGFVTISFLKTIFKSLKVILYLKIEKLELAIFSLKKQGRKFISGKILFHFSTTLFLVSLTISFPL